MAAVSQLCSVPTGDHSSPQKPSQRTPAVSDCRPECVYCLSARPQFSSMCVIHEGVNSWKQCVLVCDTGCFICLYLTVTITPLYHSLGFHPKHLMTKLKPPQPQRVKIYVRLRAKDKCLRTHSWAGWWRPTLHGVTSFLTMMDVVSMPPPGAQMFHVFISHSTHNFIKLQSSEFFFFPVRRENPEDRWPLSPQGQFASVCPLQNH